MLHDLRFALRAYRRQPAFATLAVFIVAIAAAANAAVFSVVRAVLLEPLPFSRPDQLVVVRPSGFVSNADLDFLRSRARPFTQVAVSSPGWTMTMLGAGDAVRVTATKTSANLFTMVGAAPLLGRTFVDGEDLPGRTGVVILSYPLWKSRFRSDRAVIGRTVTLEGSPQQIVGVMPPEFELLGRDAELWMPLPFDRASPFWNGTVSQCVARLRPDLDTDAAGREMRALVPEWRRALGYQDDWGRGELLVPLRERMVGDVRRPLLVLMGAVGLIVMLTAANLGTLLLGRQVTRAREFAVRRALGASPWRLVRGAAVESAAVAISGALTGIAAARVALPSLVRMLPPEIPRIAAINLDVVIVGATVGAAGVSVFLFGTVPALLAFRPGAAQVQAGRQTDPPRARRMLGFLVVSQLVLAVVLGAGAGVMIRSLAALYRVDPGFDPSHVLTLKLQPSGERYRGVGPTVAYYRHVLAAVGALPGVEVAGAINHLPLSGYDWITTIRIDEQPLPPGVTPPTAGWRMIDGSYFDAMRIPMISGRAFTDHDAQQSPAVAVVNDVFARRFFGSAAAAIGRVVRTGSASGEDTPRIVGVVGSVRHSSLAEEPGPELYRPIAQSFAVASAIVIRATGSPAVIAGAVREAVRQVDPDVPIADLMPLSTLLQDSLARPRLLAMLLGVFAIAGLTIVISGVYGVVAYTVRRREREFGIRLAIGAAPSAIWKLVVGQGLLYAATGLTVGIPAALAATTAMRSLLFGIAERDPATFVMLSGVIAAATIAATLLPAARALRVKPALVLRAE
ncbi:MAG TPA: ABC transporter permease [Vicinamibacterales bacterium]|nr:ABC transporter permease [Vicinamibacterales bacterium]